jgi:integrase
VVYDRADGTRSYRVRIRVGGKQSTETFGSYAAAQAFALTVKYDGPEAAVAQRDVADPRSSGYVPTLAELLQTHVEELTGVDERTRTDYLALARRSWLPLLGRTRVSTVTRSHVARWVNQQDGSSAPKTIKNAHSLLSSVLERAVQDGHLDRNPARGTRLPRSGEHEGGEVRYLTYAEFDVLHDALPDLYRPFVVLLFGTGLRFSEATALQVQDVQLEAPTVRVMRAWKKRKGPPQIGPPKSPASRRTIWVDQAVAAAVGPLVDGRRGTEWLFRTATGRVIQHSNFYNRVWAPACADAGLDPRPRIHDARHTHASWLIAQGVRLEVIQDRLGHEDYTTTRKVYGHLLPDLRREGGMAAAVAFAQTRLASAPSPPALDG